MPKITAIADAESGSSARGKINAAVGNVEGGASFYFDGAGSAPAVGLKTPPAKAGEARTITKWEMVARDASGNAVSDTADVVVEYYSHALPDTWTTLFTADLNAESSNDSGGTPLSISLPANAKLRGRVSVAGTVAVALEVFCDYKLTLA